ncbi:MAG: phosphoenolpyruvate carboxylase, partial [Chitinophagaceae bacterium]
MRITPDKKKEVLFNREVARKFELYNSLFLTLPFQGIKDTGSLLPFFVKACASGVEKGMAPDEIISDFFATYSDIGKDAEQLKMLFRFVQY